MTLDTLFGKTQITCLYAPRRGHFPQDGCTSLRISSLETFTLRKDLHSANVIHPSRHADSNIPSSNLDLVFCTAAILHASSIFMSEDSFSSDHFLVVFNAHIIPSFSLQSSNCFCLKELDWSGFRSNLDQHVLDLSHLIVEGPPPSFIYDLFVQRIRESLLESGAFNLFRNHFGGMIGVRRQ